MKFVDTEINRDLIRYSIFSAIENERKIQIEKWGHRDQMDSLEWLPILVEEIGEVSKAYLECKPEEIRTELIQSAAVIVAWLESIEAKIPKSS